MPQAPQTDNFADDASSTDAAKTDTAKTDATLNAAVTDTTALTTATTRWHAELYGVAPVFLAHAPATWSVIGEHVDHAGGVVVMSLAGQRAAVSVSPREDHKFVVHFRRDSLADARSTGEPASEEDSATTPWWVSTPLGRHRVDDDAAPAAIAGYQRHEYHCRFCDHPEFRPG